MSHHTDDEEAYDSDYYSTMELYYDNRLYTDSKGKTYIKYMVTRCVLGCCKGTEREYIDDYDLNDYVNVSDSEGSQPDEEIFSDVEKIKNPKIYEKKGLKPGDPHPNPKKSGYVMGIKGRFIKIGGATHKKMLSSLQGK